MYLCDFPLILTLFLRTTNRQDILVFLTGQEEIETMVQTIKSVVSDRNLENTAGGRVVNFHEGAAQGGSAEDVKLIVLPLYASLPPAQQQKVFVPARPNTRKVILSTNIAETSLTIPGVRFVVDSCRVKAK